jgi:hypothetical protein
MTAFTKNGIASEMSLTGTRQYCNIDYWYCMVPHYCREFCSFKRMSFAHARMEKTSCGSLSGLVHCF